MAEVREFLLPERFYHIYNHGNANDNIFFNDSNYGYFLTKFREYISPIADTYAYCLMPNHFHFLVKIKSPELVFKFLKENNKLPESAMNQENFELLMGVDSEINLYSLHISKQFSNFFNGYAQAINKQEARKGSLFIRAFKRKLIESTEHLKELILYIHSNPVHHSFAQNILDWKYVSYHSMISNSSTQLKREEVLELFDGVDNLKFCHEQKSSDLVKRIEFLIN